MQALLELPRTHVKEQVKDILYSLSLVPLDYTHYHSVQLDAAFDKTRVSSAPAPRFHNSESNNTRGVEIK